MNQYDQKLNNYILTYLPIASVKLTDSDVTQAVIAAGLLNFSSNLKYNIPAALFNPA